MTRFWAGKTQVGTFSFALEDCQGKTQKRSPLLLFLGSLTGWCLMSNSVTAQVTTDGTLETEVDTTDNVTEITGGTQAGSNLFHSFQDFSVKTGSTASFNNTLDINNIIGRVTGNNISNIDGSIGANGTANLILINPNGINLGDNARLDIGGSFLGSTAERVFFKDGSVFSTDLSAEPLLTISAPVGLQMGQNSAAIEVSARTEASLTIDSGNTFALVGNGITFDGGVVTVDSGRIDLGSVAEGRVNITNIAAGWQFGYEEVTQFAELQLLSESALLNPNIANQDGGIQVQGSKVVLERSQITAQTLADAPGGNIVVNASESLSLLGTEGEGTGSQISNDVSPEATGQGGIVEITTNKLNIAPRSFISSTTFGAGDAGNLKIAATEINIVGTGFAEFQQTYQLQAFDGTLQPGDRNTGIFAGTATTGTAGDITIDTDSLNLSQGAIIFNPVFTAGNGGDINVTATDIDLNASALEVGGGVGSSASASVGNINLATERLKVTDGGTVINLTFGDVAGGDIKIAADDAIELKNTPVNSIVGTGILTNTTFGSGDGGNLDLKAGKILIDNAIIASNSGAVLPDNSIVPLGGLGGNINIQVEESIEATGILSNLENTGVGTASGIGTSTFSAADGGNLTVATGKLILREGAELTSATFGAGKGGQLTIDATDSIELIGTDDDVNQGGLLANSGEIGLSELISVSGDSGDISITTPDLTVRDRATIDVQSFGIGDAGNLKIATDSIVLENQGSLVATTLSGAGGSIEIKTNTFKLDRGLINASVLGSGTGGGINIRARDSVEIVGSGFDFLQATLFNPELLSPEFLASLTLDRINDGILAAAVGEGNAGTIDIQTANLQISEGGLVATATAGSGSAGSVLLDASESLLVDASFVSSNTLFDGQGGDIEIDAQRLEVLGGGQITASTLGSGNSGSVTIDAIESVTVSGRAGEDSLVSNISVGAQPLPSTTGNGGDLTIDTPQLKIDDRAAISIGSTGSGDAGSLKVNADSITLDRRASILANTKSGEGGNINLNADNIFWQGGSFTTATAGGSGNGGNIIIQANNLVALEASQLTANAFTGRGGNIQIDTEGLFICGSCQVTASSRLGVDGVVEVEALQPNTLNSFDLPQQLTQTQEEVAVACPSETRAGNSQLTITGRGGLPNRPQELLTTKSMVEFVPPTAVKRSPSPSKTTLPSPARSWYQDAQGTVVLTAQGMPVSDNSTINVADCHTP